MKNSNGLAWTTIAEKFNCLNVAIKRSGKQCRERWQNHLDPEIIKSPWEIKEELALLNAYLKHGNKWREIAKLLPGRGENSVKNRFNILFKKYKSIPDDKKQDDVTHALEAVSHSTTKDTEWINKAIKDKTEELKAEEKKLKEEKKELVTAQPKRLYTKPEQNKLMVPELTERFINPDTQQELILSENGIFILAPDRALLPYKGFTQVTKKIAKSDIAFSVYLCVS